MHGVHTSIYIYTYTTHTMSSLVEHLHQCSVCDPPVETLDEVHQSNPVNPLEDKTARTLHICTASRAPGRVY